MQQTRCGGWHKNLLMAQLYIYSTSLSLNTCRNAKGLQVCRGCRCAEGEEAHAEQHDKLDVEGVTE